MRYYFNLLTTIYILQSNSLLSVICCCFVFSCSTLKLMYYNWVQNSNITKNEKQTDWESLRVITANMIFFYSTHVSNVGNLNLEVIYIGLQWRPFISELTRELHCCFVKGQLVTHSRQKQHHKTIKNSFKFMSDSFVTYS